VLSQREKGKKRGGESYQTAKEELEKKKMGIGFLGPDSFGSCSGLASGFLSLVLRLRKKKKKE